MSFNWRSFIKNISYNGVVPIIGNDLSMVRLKKDESAHLIDIWSAIEEKGTEDGDYIRINLYDYLALKLWHDHGVGDGPSKYTINKVILQLQNNHVGEDVINNAIIKEVSLLTDEQIFLEPYRKLAEIKGFETILTVNPDNFLERAFEAIQRQVNDSINYSIPVASVDQDKKNDRALVNIHNLMGNIKGHSFAVTEEQSLEYMHMLQRGMDTVAKDLFEAMRGKAILLIGCSFPNWFMRFFIRIIAKERFKNAIKTKYVACDSTLQDLELSYFLETNSIKLIRIGTALDSDRKGEEVYRNSIEFIDKMHGKWEEIIRNNPQAPTRFKEKLFLSYSWDDRPIVERLKNEFEKNGVSVFFDDNDIKQGARYHEVIKKYIKDCDYFVPIISRNAIGDRNRYVYDKEWRSAIVLDGYKEESYIRPYIIDDTPPSDSGIPEEIRVLNMAKVAQVDEFGSVVRDFIAENNLTALAS